MDAAPSQGKLDASRPLGVYVHFPFCGVHCPYCDFAVEVRESIPHDEYADAVVGEIAVRTQWFAGASLRSIYFGGGTPGLWRADALGRVLDGARAAFGDTPADGLEITVETNPGELAAGHAADLRRAGVNRLSIGIQSVDDRLLHGIGRNHDGAAVAPAVAAIKAAGFDNWACDLLYGLPGQSMDDWRRSIDAVLALDPPHVSAYALTIERGTPFGVLDRAGRLPRPGDDEVAAMFEWGRDALESAGLSQYEISSYARPGRRAVHNGLYWSGGAYLGAGASAASFRPLADGSGWRFSNPRAAATYLRAAVAGRGSPEPAKLEHRTRTDLESEALWLGLRTMDGVDRASHAARFGVDPVAGRDAAVRHCIDAGWLEVTPDRLRLTRAGVLFADEVATRLMR